MKTGATGESVIWVFIDKSFRESLKLIAVGVALAERGATLKGDEKKSLKLGARG
jgi:hypothetical protein